MKDDDVQEEVPDEGVVVKDEDALVRVASTSLRTELPTAMPMEMSWLKGSVCRGARAAATGAVMIMMKVSYARQSGDARGDDIKPKLLQFTFGSGGPMLVQHSHSRSAVWS